MLEFSQTERVLCSGYNGKVKRKVNLTWYIGFGKKSERMIANKRQRDERETISQNRETFQLKQRSLKGRLLTDNT
jgi:hypothetical protein